MTTTLIPITREYLKTLYQKYPVPQFPEQFEKHIQAVSAVVEKENKTAGMCIVDLLLRSF